MNNLSTLELQEVKGGISRLTWIIIESLISFAVRYADKLIIKFKK